MAELIYCPKCESEQECQKKGTNSKGEQLYMCKKCGKRFPGSASKKIGTSRKSSTTKAKAVVTKTKAVAPKAKAVVKEEISKEYTEIIVNNNPVKTIKGKSLSIDDAFDIASSYFKEIAKDKATRRTVGDKTIIEFKVSAGTKG